MLWYPGTHLISRGVSLLDGYARTYGIKHPPSSQLHDLQSQARSRGLQMHYDRKRNCLQRPQPHLFFAMSSNNSTCPTLRIHVNDRTGNPGVWSLSEQKSVRTCRAAGFGVTVGDFGEFNVAQTYLGFQILSRTALSGSEERDCSDSRATRAIFTKLRVLLLVLYFPRVG